MAGGFGEVFHKDLRDRLGIVQSLGERRETFEIGEKHAGLDYAAAENQFEVRISNAVRHLRRKVMPKRFA